MFDSAATSWAVTAVLLLSVVFHVLRARRDRNTIDRGFHALMNLLMAGMLWHFASSTMPLQFIVLLGAMLWFFTKAAGPHKIRTLCAGTQGRIMCGYHSFTMGGAAVMLGLMNSGNASDHVGSTGSAASSMDASHHVMTDSAQNPGAILGTDFFAVSFLLTVSFGVAAVIFLGLLLGSGLLQGSGRRRSSSKSPIVAEYVNEGVCAVIMALMFATML